MLNKKILSLFALVPYAFSFLPLASCGSNGIVFANYESYMSEPVKRKIESKYNTTFLPYETNEEIENKFKKYYDAAIPSTY
ncbi:MAG: hypothetical protein K2M43_02335, partial [Mycoplasmoidaceae bacterium]|nr:hypothetical protein [Mycoplasmoidaceae bacterium]